MTGASHIRIIVTILTGCAAAIFVVTIVHALWYAPEPADPFSLVEPFSTSTPVGELPKLLVIPKLAITAKVQYVGIGKTGNMAVPSNFTDVGWYRYGALPGSIGSAVMDGHVDNGFALPGVFKHLANLQQGDDIYVETGSGKKLHFVVSNVEIYPYTAVPTQQIFHATDGKHLNLITCEGAWVQGQRTYDHRLVVYAKLKDV